MEGRCLRTVERRYLSVMPPKPRTHDANSKFGEVMSAFLDNLAELFLDDGSIREDDIREALSRQPELSAYNINIHFQPHQAGAASEVITIEDYRDSRQDAPHLIEIVVRPDTEEEGDKNLRTLYMDRLPGNW